MEQNQNSNVRNQVSIAKTEVNQSRSPDDDCTIEINHFVDMPLEWEYPKPLEYFWTFSNLTRLSCWISFWTSTLIFLDSVRVSGSRMFHRSHQINIVQDSNPEEFGNPSMPIFISVIFFVAMVINGVHLVLDSKLDFEMKAEDVKRMSRSYFSALFQSMCSLILWSMTEIFLIAVSFCYFSYVYGELQISHYFVCLRILISLIAMMRLRQVMKIESKMFKEFAKD